jgi:hypothetical protein
MAVVIIPGSVPGTFKRNSSFSTQDTLSFTRVMEKKLMDPYLPTDPDTAIGTVLDSGTFFFTCISVTDIR